MSLLKRICVNPAQIKFNDALDQNKPVMLVELPNNEIRYECHGVKINGPSTVQYSKERRGPYGSRCWIETESEIELIHEGK
jgi:hypothetical protein